MAIDISMPLGPSTPSYPGDPPIRIESVYSTARGAQFNVSVLEMGTHSGTHVDPPSHFLPGRANLDQIDLAALNGPCRVVRVPEGQSSIFPSDLTAIPEGTDRVLFQTSNSARWARGEGFFPDFVDLSPPAARELIERRVRLVGIDALSVESDPTVSFPVHRALLGAGIVLLEGLLLSEVVRPDYILRCLPLRIQGGDGGPCRAILDPA
ncbi:MAG TPA: cyclase family protein [Thermoplasmata archaeon]|nr:cyclase family protein [Thermoplasmata archaeon]